VNGVLTSLGNAKKQKANCYKPYLEIYEGLKDERVKMMIMMMI
jgi:predicted glycosyl hydrolase (DUF1957 family)